jgi:hypothetical protein
MSLSKGVETPLADKAKMDEQKVRMKGAYAEDHC